jgi:hypothetical protein
MDRVVARDQRQPVPLRLLGGPLPDALSQRWRGPPSFQPSTEVPWMHAMAPALPRCLETSPHWPCPKACGHRTASLATATLAWSRTP